MANRPRPVLVRSQVEIAIARLQGEIEALRGSDNPQISAVVSQMEAQVEALEAVRDALYGDMVQMRILATG